MNIIEYIRKTAIENLFLMKSFREAFQVWEPTLKDIVTPGDAKSILDLGDSLSKIFKSSKKNESNDNKKQSDVAIAGAAWEGLICYYMNLCLIGSRTVVIKQNASLIPYPIMDSLKVKYDNYTSNTEADLIAITFPDKSTYTQDINDILIRDKHGDKIELYKNGKFQYKKIINRSVETYFDSFKLLVIQCKTNWSDNAQVPMLWDMMYSSQGFYDNSIKIGTVEFNIRNIKNFAYAFVTVPSGDKTIKPSHSNVLRVKHLSGGNYWGKTTQEGVAFSIKEIFNNNSLGDSDYTFMNRLSNEIKELGNLYSYFKLGGAND